MTTEKLDRVTTPLARASFVNVWEPRPKLGKPDEKEFSLTLLIPKGTDLTSLKKLMRRTVTAKWGDEPKNWPANLRAIDWKNYLSLTGKDGWPLRDGDAQPYDGYAGMVSIRTTSNRRPAVFDRNVQPLLDQEALYSGCYVRASLSCFAWHHKESANKGLSFSLLGVQVVKDGEPFARVAAPDDFDRVDDLEDSEDSYRTEDW